MKFKIYTDEEIQELEKNPFVLYIDRYRYVRYTNVFKLWCIIQRKTHPEKTCKDIFAEAGFDILLMNPKLPQSRIREWENTYSRFGVDYFISRTSYCRLKEELAKQIKTSNISAKKQTVIYREVLKFVEDYYDRHSFKAGK